MPISIARIVTYKVTTTTNHHMAAMRAPTEMFLAGMLTSSVLEISLLRDDNPNLVEIAASPKS